MLSLRVNDVLKDRILVSRESARLLQEALGAVMVGAKTSENVSGAQPVIIDFEGVEGVAPSFIDELLTIFESVIDGKSNGAGRSLIVANPPARLSSKFEAIARGHGMSIRAPRRIVDYGG